MQIYFSHLTNKWVAYIEDSMRYFAMRLLFWTEEEGKKPTFVCRHWKGMAVDRMASVLGPRFYLQTRRHVGCWH